MKWLEVLSIFSSFILGGGIVKLFTVKQERQSKHIDNVTRLIERYEKMNEQIRQDAEEDKRRYKEEAEEAKKQVKELTAKVNDLYQRLGKLQKDLEAVQLAYKNANAIKCENLNCKKRIPPICKEYLDILEGKEDGK